ncbi:cytochrome [Maritimibacter sp. 55A14]|uniref:cytochrome b/b6 domain-containing protein n=1 Tax=Maritimibacter sp. 55A14 TaxID=2174844 RepID=UPI000D608B96|nr:cytochrome b/b6 domain-containing protein [Maritimibacter sp. 55A14]PWE30636.1 cytochrome [Maritimibacter sp. 55A14]
MSLTNTDLHYGSVAKSLHWLTAALILTLLPLGWVANEWPMESQQEIAAKTLLFRIHKTLGVTLFFVALARIGWPLTQTRPTLLNAHKRGEAFLAETVHWLLYASLVIVPLSGWLEHSASEGFAPIWWPFGQNLPFVPKDPHLAEMFAAWHGVFTKVLIAAVVLHVAGALKHHVIDGDATLRRMLPGRPIVATPPPGIGHAAPALTAALLYGGALALATTLAATAPRDAAPALAEVASGWEVQEGTLGLTITQNGTPVTGQFAEWTAAIEFAETATEGKHGSVEVTISVPSLTLGQVTSQAMGANFFNSEAYPTATFTADILPGGNGGGYVAEGQVTIKGTSAPVRLPFELAIEGDTARMTGSTVLDRRNFEIGTGVSDPKTLGFEVAIDVDLTATRATQ